MIFTVALAAVIVYSHHVSSFSLSTSFPPLPSAQLSRPLLQKSCRRHRARSFHDVSSRLHSNSKNIDDSFVDSLLGGGESIDQDPYSQYSHQIAIPLNDASELHSALHAIQTSLVRDCPRLIRGCVMPALLRMPLLYVDGNSVKNGRILGGGSNNGVDAILEHVVHNAIREVVYGDDVKDRSSSFKLPSPGVPMIEMAKPILLPFRGLELQGDDNSVLYVVGNDVNVKTEMKPQKRIDAYYNDEDEEEVYTVDDWSDATETKTKGPSGSEILENLVYKIQSELEGKYGFRTRWPLDEPQGDEVEYDNDDPIIAAVKQRQRKWRPRVPFVRLPPDFYKNLQHDSDEKSSADGNTDDEAPSRIDMGFDGISPLFWYEAWGGEDILSPPGVRMQSVAIYRRMVPGGGESETSFYVPSSSSSSDTDKKIGNSLELPVGDSKIMARERREKAKAMERLGDVESRAEREWEEGKARWMEERNNDQSLSGKKYSSPDDEQLNGGIDKGAVTVVGDAAYSTIESAIGVHSIPERVEDDVQTETGHIQSDFTFSTLPQPSVTKPRRELPNFEDNPIFQRLWKGQSQVTHQGQNTALTLDGTPPSIDEPLPPYPSDAHFVGPWRVLSSPLGIDKAVFADAESKSSDNFILRVDGQVMGGPILDAQYQHKAAGGEWKMFRAIRKSGASSSSIAPPETQTRLRIRLLVPPEKDRALVMEGEVTRLIMPGTVEDVSSSDQEWTMASGGVLDGMLQSIEDMQPQAETKNGEGLLYCSGEVWMEDAEGGTKRKKVGTFALMKLKSVDRKNLIYTVDVSRSLRGDSDNEGDVETEE
jgi:hypothetical protein